MKRFIPYFLLFALLAAGMMGCDNHDVPAETEAEPVQCLYTIVRGDRSSQEETDGAVRLRKTLEEYGYAVQLVTDWVKRGEDVEEHRYAHEILFGDTNRAESISAYEELQIGERGMSDYIVTSDGEDYILAAAPGCVDEAVDILLSVFTEDLTRLETVPVEVNESRKRTFPLEDITICGVSVEEYDFILYSNTYSHHMESDLQELSDLIFSACGTRIPIQREAPVYEGQCIHVGRRLDAEVQAGGDFSYGVIPSADGMIIEGQDTWNDWAALDALQTTIRNAIPQGGTLAIDEPILRLTDPADDDPLSTLQLAAWVIGSPQMSTESQFAEIADCGFNQIILHTPADGAVFHDFAKWMAKYQLRGLWGDSHHHLENWQNNNKVFQSNDAYLNESVTWGHMLRDEPNAEMYADLAEMFTQYEEAAPGKVPFINLFPIYANADQMKVATYQEYVDLFFEIVDPWYASVDIYPLNIGNKIIPDYFVNLDIFAAACRERNVPFGVYIQSVSFASSKRTPIEPEMRWQAYNALAFGASNIEYFTYRTPDSSAEVFTNALIGRDNQKTERWYGAQKINHELAVMAEAFMQYRHLGCWSVNPQNAPDFFYFDNQYKDFGAVEEITVTDDNALLMGGFEAREGEGKAFVCVNTADPGTASEGIAVTMALAEGYTGAVLYKMGERTVLTPDGNGCISFTLSCGEGVFAELTK